MESKSCFFGVAQLLKKNVHGGFVIDVIGYREGRKKKKKSSQISQNPEPPKMILAESWHPSFWGGCGLFQLWEDKFAKLSRS